LLKTSRQEAVQGIVPVVVAFGYRAVLPGGGGYVAVKTGGSASR